MNLTQSQKIDAIIKLFNTDIYGLSTKLDIPLTTIKSWKRKKAPGSPKMDFFEKILKHYPNFNFHWYFLGLGNILMEDSVIELYREMETLKNKLISLHEQNANLQSKYILELHISGMSTDMKSPLEIHVPSKN